MATTFFAKGPDMVGMDSHEPKDRDKAASVGARLGLSLFFLFFFTLGSLFEALLIRQFGQTISQRSWKKTPCTILGSEVQERGESEEPFAFTVRYQYTCAGQSYTGSRYRRSDAASGSYSDMQRLVQKYPAGRSAFCYVDPKDPGQAVLRRDSLLLGLVIPFPLIFVVIGAGGAFLIWRKQTPETEKSIAAGALRERRKGKGKSRYAVAALFALFAIVGGALLYPLGIKPIAKTITAESWVATPCQVLRAEVRSHDSDDGTTYSPYVLYQYEFQGQMYKSDRYEFIGGSSSGYEGKARVVEQYKTASNPVCYVNPDNPFEAVLKRGFHAKLLLVLFPLVFLLIGMGGLAGVLRGEVGAGDTMAKPWLTRQQMKAADDSATLRATDSGRTALVPALSARTKLIGTILVALFWNGIISIFVYHIVDGFRQGHPSWFGLLFLLPFVAIGMGMIGGVGYYFLALFNPRPTLELNPSVIPLGTAAQVGWSLSGRTSRIRTFTVTLRGVEEARYRKGTSTYTDHNTFFEVELYRTCDPGEIASGQVGFVIPPDTMHSFGAENNKILWSLDLRGSIQGWPDVKESFPITVAPAAG